MGDISDDCFDRAIDELMERDEYPFIPSKPRCRACGERGHWGFSQGRWILLGDNLRPHHCSPDQDFA